MSRDSVAVFVLAAAPACVAKGASLAERVGVRLKGLGQPGPAFALPTIELRSNARPLPAPTAVTALRIRPASPADLDALATLFDAYRQFYEQTPDWAGARRFLGERMARQESVILVAEASKDPSQGHALGLCQLYPSFCSVAAAPIYVLYDLFVHPKARRAGVGRALLQAAAARAQADGKRRMDLTTARTNHQAQSLYESLGWVRDEVFLTYTLAVS